MPEPAAGVRVPFLDLAAQHAPLRAELLAALARVVEREAYILGEEGVRLEADLAALHGVPHAVAVSSGTDALLVALMALGVGPGDEVVTTPFSFFATAGVIARLGAVPVLADIRPDTFALDPAAAEAAVTPRTKAILPVHLFGQCADMDPLRALAARRGLALVEDAAQAVAAQYRTGERAGSMGIAGCLSFYPTKNLGGMGDGGMVLTRDASFAEKVRLLRVHGGARRYHHEVVGGNFRLDEFQAAVLNVKLPRLAGWNAARRARAQRYEDLLAGSGAVLPLAAWRPSGVPDYHVWHQYVVRVPDRDRVREVMAAAGVATDVFYPVPFHLQPCFAGLGLGEGAFPEAERAAREVLALPMHPDLDPKAQDAVAAALRGALTS